MKSLLTFIIILLLNNTYTFASSSKVVDSTVSRKVEIIDKDLQQTKKDLFDKTVVSYQLTNDRINNYLTFTAVIATMFGVIMALGGIWVGFESLKSQRKRDEAIKILEDAKKYVEEKKSTFDTTIQAKLTEIETDYKKLIDLNKERLLSDISNEVLSLKELTEKKAYEIENLSIHVKDDKAIEALQKRIDFFENIGIPDDPKILLSKAKLLREKQMPNEAIELLLKVIFKESDNWDAYWELGFAYANIKSFNKAIESYQKSLAIRDSAPAHNNLGAIYEELDRPIDSIKEFEIAAQLDPSKKLYLNNKARMLVKVNSIDLAVEVYQSLIDKDKSDLLTYRNLINLLSTHKRYDEVIKYYDLSILNIPDKAAEFNFSKALFLNRIDKKAEAFTLLQNLVTLNYKIEECLQLMAIIKVDLGELNEASKILSSINELNIKNPFYYLKKSELFITNNIENAIEIINEGKKHVDSYEYLLNAARVFAKNKAYDQAKTLQREAISILKETISKRESVDILTCYETYILLNDYDSAKKIINENSQFITTSRYKLILEFLKICLSFLENTPFNLHEALSELKNLKSDNSEKINWIFDDIKYYLDSKLDEAHLSRIENIVKFLKSEISYDEMLK